MTAIKIMFAILICIPLAAVSYFFLKKLVEQISCLLYTSPSPRDRQKSRMPSSA